MSAIRRANPKTQQWRRELFEFGSDKITNIDADSESRPGLFEEYPYSNQEIISGTFEYLIQRPRNRDPRPHTVNFQYRTRSDLLIIDPGSRDDLTDDIVYEVRKCLADDVQILPNLSVSRSSLWDFVMSAPQKGEIVVRHNSQEILYEEIEDMAPEEIIGEDIIIRADLTFEYDGSLIDVIYTKNRLSIKSQNGDEFEYVIQRFEYETKND